MVGGKVLSSPQRTVPPEGRNMSMIFQSYALWPHMTVAENVAYGLKIRKLDRAAIDAKLKAILSTARLEALADRYPGELSGGQQQRVSPAARAGGRARDAAARRAASATSTPTCARRCASRSAACTTSTATPRST